MRSLLRLLGPLSLSLVAAPLVAFAQPETHPAGHARAPALGTIVFPNSGNAAAQEPFLRGIAFLHSFEYDEAADDFKAAQHADAGFALAYWGEALSYSHMLWGIEDLAAVRSALGRLGSTSTERLAKARTPRERAFGAAVEAYFSDAPRAQRIRVYADSLRRYALADPNDQEGAAFAAHALLLSTLVAEGSAKRDSLTREAIAFAKRVVGANPKHPGATHYLIHLYDSPAMAAEGLAFARAYDTIAPDAEHALHMPSHIYLQLGLWDEVVKSNERAWAASRAAQSPDWHAFSWLQYAYLQQGRFAAARGLIDTARALQGGGRGDYADASVLARLNFQYAAETGRWGEPGSRPPLSSADPASDRERHMRMFESYWLAVDAAQRGDTATVLPGPPPFTKSVVPQVEALLAKARGDRAGYLRGLAASAEQERNFRAFSGPPERLMSLEILGAELLADGRVAESIKAYEDVLRLCPNRSRALLGLARAKSVAGDRAGAAELYGKLRANWARADMEVAASVPHF